MNIAIIGAGAAGMMAAATLAEESKGACTVFLIERNSLLGNKVLISGGGRCNVTTGVTQMDILMKKYPRGATFLRTALYSFPPRHVYEWFEHHGVPLKIEEDARVFPVSNNGKDIVTVFDRIFKKYEVSVLFRRKVTCIEKQEHAFCISFQEHPDLKVDKVLIATGGQAFRHTGSTGDGYTFAEQLGHHITPLAPSLNALVLQEEFLPHLAGISFQNVRFELLGKKIYTMEGACVFTHKGISGPAVFALSSMSCYEQYSKETPLQLRIDYIPEKSFSSLEEEILLYQKTHHKRAFFSLLREYVPQALAEMICIRLAMDGKKILAEVPKKKMMQLVNALKQSSFPVIGRGEGEEFVTAGGVDIHDIHKKTMESKICPGLFFAGEIMDIDGFTGGFNLQASWATGRLAAHGMLHPR